MKNYSNKPPRLSRSFLIQGKKFAAFSYATQREWKAARRSRATIFWNFCTGGSEASACDDRLDATFLIFISVVAANDALDLRCCDRDSDITSTSLTPTVVSALSVASSSMLNSCSIATAGSGAAVARMNTGAARDRWGVFQGPSFFLIRAAVMFARSVK